MSHRTEVLAQQRQKKRQESMQRRKQASERLQRNREKFKSLEREMRDNYEQKQMRNMQRKMMFEEALQQRFETQRQINAQKEDQRRHVKLEAELAQERRVNEILDKRERAQIQLMRVQEERERQREHNHHLMRLKQQERLINVERIARKQQFEQEQIRQKLHEDDVRTESIAAQKQKLLTQRRENQLQTAFEKQKMVDQLHHMKITKKYDFSRLSRPSTANSSLPTPTTNRNVSNNALKQEPRAAWSASS